MLVLTVSLSAVHCVYIRADNSRGEQFVTRRKEFDGLARSGVFKRLGTASEVLT